MPVVFVSSSWDLNCNIYKKDMWKTRGSICKDGKEFFMYKMAILVFRHKGNVDSLSFFFFKILFTYF